MRRGCTTFGSSGNPEFRTTLWSAAEKVRADGAGSYGPCRLACFGLGASARRASYAVWTRRRSRANRQNGMRVGHDVPLAVQYVPSREMAAVFSGAKSLRDVGLSDWPVCCMRGGWRVVRPYLWS
jgi:hypothetical protein